MREAQGWSGRTSPRICPLSNAAAHLLFPGLSSHGFTPDAAPPPRSQQRAAASRITPRCGRCQLQWADRLTPCVIMATRKRITP
jgi:hypothetical protein